LEKLTITATLATPFVTGGGYMTFDAILAGTLFDQIGDVDEAHAAIPIQCTEGLYHASAAFFKPLDYSSIDFVANLRANHSLDPSLIAKKPDGKTIHKAIGMKRRRDFGAVMNTYSLICANSITCCDEGDRSQIENLVAPIYFIGTRRASGFGEVSSWEIEEGVSDGLTGSDKKPLRPIPEAAFTGDKTSLRADTGWRPAYWHPADRSICYVSELLL